VTFQWVRDQVRQACAAAGRDPSEVRLLPVSKTHPVSALTPLIGLGVTAFAENRVQEMAAKAEALAGSGHLVDWVMIGHLQRNKAAAACSVMSELQSLDSLDLALALERWYDRVRPEQRLPVLVEVNTSGEDSKSGIPVEEVMDFTARLHGMEHLRLRGLMTVAHPDPDLAELGFVALSNLRMALQDRDGGGWPELSMGMSGDFQRAIARGATCVRIGTAIFGARGS